MKRIVCFSGGHSSALAAIEVARKYGSDGMILLNHDISPHVEHEDIKRFKLEVAEYIGLPVTYANMPGWETTPPLAVAVANKDFKAFTRPAFCTSRLKTEPFYKWLGNQERANSQQENNEEGHVSQRRKNDRGDCRN